MINVDLRRYGTDDEYRKMINGFISGADIDEMPTEIRLDRELKGLRETTLIDKVKAFNMKGDK